MLAAFAAGVLLLLSALLPAEAQTASGRRVALVIGNTDYRHVERLKNAAGDAEAIAAKLRSLGFEVTPATVDLDRKSFLERLRSFKEAATDSEAALFYFSGHAFQLGGINYLVPTDAVLRNRERIGDETVSLNDIIAEIRSPSRKTLIFLDACRNNPLPAKLRPASDEGLAKFEGSNANIFIAFSTDWGAVAVDGVGAHSPFTGALLDHIEEAGTSINDMMDAVSQEVYDKTVGKQTPARQSGLLGGFFFNKGGDAGDRQVVASRDNLQGSLPAEGGAGIPSRAGGTAAATPPADDGTAAPSGPIDEINAVEPGADPGAPANGQQPVAGNGLQPLPAGGDRSGADGPIDEINPVETGVAIGSTPGQASGGNVQHVPPTAAATKVRPEAPESVTVAMAERPSKPIDVLAHPIDAAAHPSELESALRSAMISGTADDGAAPAASESPLALALSAAPERIDGKDVAEAESEDVVKAEALAEPEVKVAALEPKVTQEPEPATPPIALPPAPGESDQEAMVRAIKQSLKGLGCYAGPIDGNWNEEAAEGLDRYFKAGGDQSGPRQPSAALRADLEQGGVFCAPEDAAQPAEPAAAKADDGEDTGSPDAASPSGAGKNARSDKGSAGGKAGKAAGNKSGSGKGKTGGKNGSGKPDAGAKPQRSQTASTGSKPKGGAAAKPAKAPNKPAKAPSKPARAVVSNTPAPAAGGRRTLKGFIGSGG